MARTAQWRLRGGRRPAGGSAVFDRVVAGVDGSEAGFEAARQAARLVAPDGLLETLTVVWLPGAELGRWSRDRLRAELDRAAGQTIRETAAIVGPRARRRLVEGVPVPAFLRVLREERATLAAIGTHGSSRLSEIVLGGVGGELLHSAPCSVLVARPPEADEAFPGPIVVGVDGSRGAAAADAAAHALADRFGTPLTRIVADGDPVGALVDASAGAGLLVVGSRGLGGLRALGSVSERVAHRARCSVLVVREIDPA